MLAPLSHARGYMPQLDALRTLAVAAVAWSHWAPREYQAGIPWGPYGVKLFFVLSGFLITSILLDCRAAGEESPGGQWLPLRSFYIRRFLRLMPLYYATLLLAALCNLKPVPETLGWTLTYTANFYFYQRGAWHGVISHFWSLAVEEQFYLVWPWVILFVPARWLKATVIGTAAVSAAAWLALTALDLVTPVTTTLPLLCCDALGLGSLLAIVGEQSARSRLAKMSLAAGSAIWLLAAAPALFGYGHPVLGRVQQECVLLAFLWVIERAAVGFPGRIGQLLENRVLIGLGTISYGLYILHQFAPPILMAVLRTCHLPRWLGQSLPIRVLLLSLITIALAWVSWQVLEQPIQSLKRHFPYRRKKAPVDDDGVDHAAPRRRAA